MLPDWAEFDRECSLPISEHTVHHIGQAPSPGVAPTVPERELLLEDELVTLEFNRRKEVRKI